MEKEVKQINELLGIKYPIIVAPMFLISNAEMTISAIRAGCTAAIPALNYRTSDELRAAIREVKSAAKGPIGINLIVNKSNFRLNKDLDVCLEEGVDFYITSLGSPKTVIEKAHEKNQLVFCDVVNVEYAEKVEKLGADAVIAVNNSAGGHAGPKDMKDLVGELKNAISIPIISAGGVSTSKHVQEAIHAGAAGVSVGTIFIASDEAPVTDDYKQAMITYGKDDIVMTTRLSGTPCTVIKTPYVEKIGLEPTWLERLMKKYSGLKKIIKAILFIQGMKKLRKSAFGFSYKSVWCAGPAIENVKSIRPMKEIIEDLVEGLN